MIARNDLVISLFVPLAVGYGCLVGCNSETQSPTEPTAETPTFMAVTLSVGDLAPEFEVGEWMKGQPLNEFAKGQIYVIDFWATWCAPCLTSLPHLSELHAEYGKQVTFVGVTYEPAETVNVFLDGVHNRETGGTWDQVLTYSIAADGRKMKTSYMEAAMQTRIPTVFVVGRDRRIQWIGHPLGLALPLSQIVQGDWDLAEAKRQFEAKTYVAALQQQLHLSIREATKNDDWSNVLNQIDQLAEAGADPQAMEMMRYGALIEARMPAQSQQLVAKLADEYWDDSTKLNEFAWDVVTRIPREHRDYELATRLAVRANELSEYRQAGALDTLARVYYEQGDLKSAIEFQQKAVEANADGVQIVQETLDKYLKEQTADE